MVYELTDLEIKLCQRYADQMYRKNIQLYDKMYQVDEKAIKQKLFDQKKGQLGCHKYISENFDPLCFPPDFQILQLRQIDGDPDFITPDNNYYINVISKEEGDKFGIMWRFPKTVTIFHKHKESDMMMFCIVDENIVFIYDIKLIGSLGMYIKEEKDFLVIYEKDLKEGTLNAIG